MCIRKRIVRWISPIVGGLAVLQMTHGGTGLGWLCKYWGSGNLDNRGYLDNCMGITVPNCSGQWCVVYSNLPYGWYCTTCTQEGCTCYGFPVTGYESDGSCTHDSGPDACYCRYDENNWKEFTADDCSS